MAIDSLSTIHEGLKKVSANPSTIFSRFLDHPQTWIKWTYKSLSDPRTHRKVVRSTFLDVDVTCSFRGVPKTVLYSLLVKLFRNCKDAMETCLLMSLGLYHTNWKWWGNVGKTSKTQGSYLSSKVCDEVKVLCAFLENTFNVSSMIENDQANSIFYALLYTSPQEVLFLSIRYSGSHRITVKSSKCYPPTAFNCMFCHGNLRPTVSWLVPSKHSITSPQKKKRPGKIKST